MINMEEIKINEYVRLDDGTIGKVIPYDNGIKIRITEVDTWKPTIESIKKHSSNIIDLIEVGDYVNGYKVYDISTEYLVDINKDGKILHIEKEGFINATITEGEDNIKSICTKEQFAAAEYKLDN